MWSLLKNIFNPHHHIFDFDGDLYIEKKQQLVKLNSLDDIQGPKKVLTDFNNQAFARVIYIESQPKYAEVLARKKIIDSGEFEDAVEIIVHKKQKVGEHTKLYCTPVPLNVIENYRNHISSSEDALLFCSVHNAFLEHIEHKKYKKPALLILAHRKSFDVLIASAKQIYFAGRFNAFEYDSDSIESIWEIIIDEINKVQKELAQPLQDANLYHSGIERNIQQIISQSLGRVSIKLSLPASNKQHNLDFLIKPVAINNMLGSLINKMYYIAQKNLLLINSIAATVAFMLFSLSALATWQINNLDQDSQQKKADISQFKLPVINMPQSLDSNVRFYESIKKLDERKQISHVFTDLAAAASTTTQIKKMRLQKKDEKTIIEISGLIISDFDNAYQNYKNMVNTMKNKSYAIDNENFATDINQSSFSFTLEYH